MDNNLYKNVLQESYIIDTFSIRHDVLLTEFDLLNFNLDDIKRKINKAFPMIEKTLKKYKINVNDIKKLAKQTGNKFINDLKLDKIKNKEKQKEKVMEEARKQIQKKYDIKKIKAAIDDKDLDAQNKNGYIVEIIFNFMIAVYLFAFIAAGIASPLTYMIFVWCIIDIIRSAYNLSH